MLRFPVRWYAPAAPIEPQYARPRHVPPLRRQLASTTCWPRGSTSPFPDRAASCTGAACCADNDYLKRGSATVSFLLSDVRTTYVFALVQGDAQYPMLAAVSNTVAHGAPSQASAAPPSTPPCTFRRPQALCLRSRRASTSPSPPTRNQCASRGPQSRLATWTTPRASTTRRAGQRCVGVARRATSRSDRRLPIGALTRGVRCAIARRHLGPYLGCRSRRSDPLRRCVPPAAPRAAWAGTRPARPGPPR